MHHFDPIYQKLKPIIAVTMDNIQNQIMIILKLCYKNYNTQVSL